MNLTDYVRLVLPEEGNGFYCASTLLQNGKFSNRPRFSNRHFETLADLTTFVEKVNRTTPHNVYVSTNSFITSANRKQENASKARAVFLDMDVGSDKPYASQKDAVDALKAFCDESGFQFPVILSSGNGIYAVWPWKESISSTIWTNVTKQFAKILTAYGVKPDPAITSNSSAVLRPAGTHNKKDPSKYKPVQVITTTLAKYTPITVKQFVGYMAEAMRRKGLKIEKIRTPTQAPELAGWDIPESHRPFSIDRAAKKCAQLAQAKANRGAVEEPLWYAILGVAAYAVEPTAVHDYSDGFEGYDAEETERKAEQWKARTSGATTCHKFEALNPAGCSLCPFRGKITSPIKLGYPDATPLPTPKIHDTDFPEPRGFKRTDKGLQVTIDGESITFYPYDVYPVSVAYDTGLNTEVATFRHKLPHEAYTEFQFETRILADNKQFHQMLLGNGISILTMENVTRMKFYMGGYLESIRATRERDTLYATLGWKDLDSDKPYFVVGETALYGHGETRHIGVSKSAPEIVQAFKTRGHEKRARSGFLEISRCFDKPDMEPLAFALLCVIGAPLMKFTGLNGATVSLVGKGGEGKTLTARLGLSAYGSPDGLLLLAQDSQKFMSKRLGVLCNLPMVIDEVTNVQDEQVSNMLYGITNGRDRGRLKRDTSEREGAQWQTIGVVTSNQYISSKLMYRADASAELNRLIELPVKPAVIDMRRGKIIDTFIRENHGFVGREFIAKCVENVKNLSKAIDLALEEIMKTYKPRYDERFALNVAAVAYTTGTILKKLGLIDFDFKRVIAWVCKQIGKEKIVREEMICSPGEAVSRYLTENLGSSLLLGYIEGRDKKVVAAHLNPGQHIQKILVRYDYHFHKPEDSTVSIAFDSFKEWLSKQLRMDIRQVKDWLMSYGYFTGECTDGSVKTRAMGALTQYKTGAIRTWKLKLQAIGEEKAVGNITHIAKADRLFPDAVKEIKNRMVARKLVSPFDPSSIVDGVEI